MSTITVTNAQKGATTAYDLSEGVAKSRLRYDQSGTPTILASVNISSVTDAATGIFEPNYSTLFEDTTYTIVGITTSNSMLGNNENVQVPTTALCRLTCHTSAGSTADENDTHVEMTGDLAA